MATNLKRRIPTAMLALVTCAALASFGSVVVEASEGPDVVIERPTDRAPEPPADDGAEQEVSIDTPEPTRWRPPRKRCGKRRGPCAGPRRVPQPHGRAQGRAKRLGLGKRRTASRLLTGPPRPSWTDAAQGVAKGSLLWPVDRGSLGRGFGFVRRRAKRSVRHDGVDIPGTPGTPVRAVNDGIVAYSDNGVRGFGNFVIVVHPDATVTMYAHLRAAYLFAGQYVRRGQVIGELGNTGLSRGPHLHFEWRKRGRPRNPAPRFVRAREQAAS